MTAEMKATKKRRALKMGATANGQAMVEAVAATVGDGVTDATQSAATFDGVRRRQHQQQQRQQRVHEVLQRQLQARANNRDFHSDYRTANVNFRCCHDVNCDLGDDCSDGGGAAVDGTTRFSSTAASYTACETTPQKHGSTDAATITMKMPTSTLTPTPMSTAKTLASSATATTFLLSNDGATGGDGVFSHNDWNISIRLDPLSWILFILAVSTRFYRLATPRNIVFDELHYGKCIALYMRNVFFFDQHPPLGKLLIAGVASLAGYDGNTTFAHIGAEYTAHVPLFWLRFVPALSGSLLAPVVYKLLLEMRLSRWTSLLGGLMVILDNALLTQSRFVLMEPMLLLCCTLGVHFLLRFQRAHCGSASWLLSGLTASTFLTFATAIKYTGILSGCLAVYLMCRYLWDLLYDANVTDIRLMVYAVVRIVLFAVIPLAIYMGVFYVHMQMLYRAGPHDSVMTSAFQASLEGGLASITKGQPLSVVHGSQITLRHTHGRTCWLHSHLHVYPVRYPDKRGSSHQQQVTCYSFKDVNNWWIVKRPDRDDLVVGDEPSAIRDGDVIQLVHGITSRALNSHDVAAPITPQCQEVTCYIDYEIQMPGELLWRVHIQNKDAEGPVWHAIKSQVRLVHESTGAALRFSGRQLPDWGFNQHEVVADRMVEQIDTIWNVEEHRYTKSQDQRERERQLLTAEMIPTKRTSLSFWEKFLELQTKMLWHPRSTDSHMYSSEPLEWPLLDKGIAYWVDSRSNSQIHLLGNIVLWYSSSLGLLVYVALCVFYLVRRRRFCYDLEPNEWQRFRFAGDLFFVGYLIHYLPYFFIDGTLFLHHYLPALLFKFLLLCFVIEHTDYLLRQRRTIVRRWCVLLYRCAVLLWLLAAIVVFGKFLSLNYGVEQLSAAKVMSLRWKDTWDFVLQKNHKLI